MIALMQYSWKVSYIFQRTSNCLWHMCLNLMWRQTHPINQQDCLKFVIWQSFGCEKCNFQPFSSNFFMLRWNQEYLLNEKLSSSLSCPSSSPSLNNSNDREWSLSWEEKFYFTCLSMAFIIQLICVLLVKIICHRNYHHLWNVEMCLTTHITF